METADLLGFGNEEARPPPPPQSDLAMKRDHDSVDDFEHLDRDHHARETDLLMPTPAPPAPAATVQSFLDTEREEITVAPPRAAHAGHAGMLTDKFTDSESEEPSESPLRKPPPVPPQASRTFDPEPIIEPKLIKTPSPVLEPVMKLSPAVSPPAPASRPAERPPAPPPAGTEPEKKPITAHIIEAEVIFCQMGLDAWFNPERLHPKVEALIYWRDPVRSGAALGAGLALLVALACCSVVSVLAYVSLLVLTGTVAFRIYKNVVQAVQKTSEGHPFKWLLDVDIALPAERTQQIAAAATAHANAAAHELRRLFLVEDLIDSLKFGVVLWTLTYVGAWFNGITLIILGYVALFTLPKAYEANKAQVDANLELARAKINEISAKVRAAVPLGKKEGDKDK